MFQNVNPPLALSVFGLFATVICFGLEQIGVGVKGADPEKLQKTLGRIAILFGGVCQLVGAAWLAFFGPISDSLHVAVFGFFGFFWILVGLHFIKGGDKKAMAHFFFTGLVLCILFTMHAVTHDMLWPLGIDLIVIDILLVSLIIGWYTGNKWVNKFAGLCNIAIGIISFFLLYSNALKWVP